MFIRAGAVEVQQELTHGRTFASTSRASNEHMPLKLFKADPNFLLGFALMIDDVTDFNGLRLLIRRKIAPKVSQLLHDDSGDLVQWKRT